MHVTPDLVDGFVSFGAITLRLAFPNLEHSPVVGARIPPPDLEVLEAWEQLQLLVQLREQRRILSPLEWISINMANPHKRPWVPSNWTIIANTTQDSVILRKPYSSSTSSVKKDIRVSPERQLGLRHLKGATHLPNLQGA